MVTHHSSVLTNHNRVVGAARFLNKGGAMSAAAAAGASTDASRSRLVDYFFVSGYGGGSFVKGDDKTHPMERSLSPSILMRFPREDYPDDAFSNDASMVRPSSASLASALTNML